MKIVTVIPFKDIPNREDLTYFSSKDVKNGDIVSVPIRGKATLGIVIETKDADDVKSDVKNMPFNLKKVEDVKEKSIFNNKFIDSIHKTSEYFVVSKSKVSEILIPAIVKNNYDKISPFYKEPAREDEKETNVKLEKLLLQSNFLDRISIYKTLIRGSFAEKKSVYIVLPGENDIENFYKELSRGIENFTITIHSGISPKKTLEKIKDILTKDHPLLIIGTAPFLSIPRDDLGVIILEQESSNFYKTVKKPYLDLRTFVEIFSTKIKAKLIFGDTLLRFETIGRKETEGLNELYPMSFRTNFREEIIISSREKEETEKEFRIFNNQALEEISRSIEKKEKIFIFSLRKGLATQTVCRDCGEIITCDKCLVPLVLYLSKDKKKRMFACNKCGDEKSSDLNCGRCGGWNLFPLGIGTDTVMQELTKYFKKDLGSKIFKIDRESIKTEKELKNILSDFEQEGPSILVGTEMALMYMKQKVDLSVVSSFDSLWNIPNFRMSEKIIKLLLGLISKTDKKIIIQTKNHKDPILKSLLEENFSNFVRNEIEERKTLHYPPFYRFIKVSFTGDKKSTENARTVLKEIFEEYNPEIFSGFISKQKEEYVTNALIRIESRKWCLKELSSTGIIDENLKNKLSLLPNEFTIAIDPEDLL